MTVVCGGLNNHRVTETQSKKKEFFVALCLCGEGFL
jgi:hypothetical protein